MRARLFVAFFLIFAPFSVSAHAQSLGSENRAWIDYRQPPEKDAGRRLGHTRAIRSLDFSPNGKLIVTCADDHTIRFWDARTGTLLQTIATDGGNPFFARFTPDGRAIVASFRNHVLGKWSVPEGKPLVTVRSPEEDVSNLLWSPDGKRFVTAGTKGSITVWSLDLHVVRRFPTRFDWIALCGFTPQGGALVHIGFQNLKTRQTVHPPAALDLQTGRKVPGWFDAKPLRALHFSPDRSCVVAEDFKGPTRLQRASTGAVMKADFLGEQDEILFVRSGSRALHLKFVSVTESRMARLLSPTTWKPVGPPFRVDSGSRPAISPDGRAVAFIAQHNNRFHLVSTTSGKTLWASADPHLILGSKPGLTLLKKLSEDYSRYALPIPDPGKMPENSTSARSADDPLREVEDLSTAVLHYREGHAEEGLTFLKRKLAGYRGDVRLEVANTAWRYWEESLTRWGRNLTSAVQPLHRLFDDVKPLRTDHNRALLADLDLTLKSVGSPHTGIEGEIDKLVTIANGISLVSDFGSLMEIDNLPAPLPALCLRGFDAVPVLLAHVEDRRLTCWERIDQDGMPDRAWRVGEIVSEILFSLAGRERIQVRSAGELVLASRQSAEAWWTRAGALGEERYLRENILPSRPRDHGQANIYNASLLARKYPDRLFGVYEELLTRYPKAFSSRMASLVAAAKTRTVEQEQLLVRTATTGGPEQRLGGFWALLDIQYPKTMDLVLAYMETVPPKPEGEYEEAGELAMLLVFWDDPRGWNALERLARRSVPTQRFQILSVLGVLGGHRRGRPLNRHQIEFLARFLDDTTVCDFTQEPALYRGRRLDFDLEKVTIRDSVLRHAAFRIGVTDYPVANWTPEQWDAWRPVAREAVRRYLAAAPGGE